MTTQVLICNLGPRKIYVECDTGFGQTLNVHSTTFLNVWDGGNIITIKELPLEETAAGTA